MAGSSPQDYVANLKDLPSLPSVAMQALAVAEDPASTASDLLRVIMSDPPLAAKVLRVANSVHFNRGYDVSDLQTAIVRMGFTNVRNLLMGVSVIRSFNGYFVGAPYTREDFWVHSIAVGVTASRLSGSSSLLCGSSSFVMGLLHDLGKLVLDRVAREAFHRTIREAGDAGVPLFEAERSRLGCDHAAVTGALLERWRFPREVVEPVRWHHEPGRCDPAHRSHAELLGVADWMCNTLRVGFGGNSHPAKPSVDLLRRLRLSNESIEKAAQSLQNEPLLSLLLPV